MKSVVIASGKGGTGKTTLSALFARLTSEHMTVVVDGDVEASNLPLALRATDASCAAFPGGARAVIDAELCTGCEVCTQVCRFQAISRSAAGVCVVDRFACEGCGCCVASCPNGAVVMKPSTAGEACLGESDVGPIAYGQLGPGEDLSGRLVTEVRRLGSQAAERRGADVLLIDGPPGIGCPLIAAIASTDLVVAVAEPSVSGAYDLGRLADVVARLGLPMRVVLNKADLSVDGASEVRDLCASRSLTLLGEVPFDTALADLGSAVATEMPSFAATSTPGMGAVASVWRALERELGLQTRTAGPRR
jgi:MinD superfamily P-loop ATPase